MIRICSSLAGNGYQVLLVGRKMPRSIPLTVKPFHQKRLPCLFNKGKLFYIEYNIRLFFYLLFSKADVIGSIDLDTILPGYLVSRLRGITRVYDAHELFCEMKEIISRPAIYKWWKWVEKKTVPFYKHGYTVSQPIAAELKDLYGVQYETIWNIGPLLPLTLPEKKDIYILYQGAVNEGRCFETLIPAMQEVNAPLIICGDGNFMPQARKLVEKYGLEQKVLFKGMLPPEELKNYTLNAYIGINLNEDAGKSIYYSLSNRFFDYLQAGVPQLCVDFPAYHELNQEFKVALLINDLSSKNISFQLNFLLSKIVLYKELQHNCLQARQSLNWQQEEKKLINFYNKVLA